MGCAYREVIATEVAKASVAAALYNIEANKLSNVHVARLSSEEFVQAWKGDREFFRMKGLPDVRGRKFQTLLVCSLCSFSLPELLASALASMNFPLGILPAYTSNILSLPDYEEVVALL